MPAERVSWRRALAWRMARHRLVERAAPADLVRVAGDICGLHAQLMSSAELSLWARIDGLDRAAVNAALWTHRTLVKVWAARGTLYLLPSAELGTWLSALKAPAEDPFTEAVGRALDGRVLTREELARKVEQATGSAEFGEYVRFSWGSYLKAASFRGLLCFAPGDGRLVRFTSPQTWVPGGIERSDPQDALRAITRRFLAAYAPARPEELTRWWVGPPLPRRGREMIAALGDEAVEVDVDGQRAWVLAADLPALLAAEPSNVARLLPAFDPWVIGAARQAPLLQPAHVSRVYRPQGWVSPVLLVNGQVAGVWKHTRRGSRVMVEIEPFGRLPAWAGKQLKAETERLAEFLGHELAVTSQARSIANM